MSDENKNPTNSLKDPERSPTDSYGAGTKDMSVNISYTKTNKLITALFMVTDIIQKDEPIRHKLRTLGTEVISDIHSNPTQSRLKIDEIVSFLDIALAINLVSRMNHSILFREFSKLKESLQEHDKISPTWLDHFFSNPPAEKGLTYEITPPIYNGHSLRTPVPSNRIGVQKGHTLLKAIKSMSDKISTSSSSVSNNFDELKKSRREDIYNILKSSDEGMVITDIKLKAKGLPVQFKALVSCSEKTLQRELVSMLKDGVLKKTGEKRWSRYSIK